MVDANGIWFDAQSASGACFYLADVTDAVSGLNGRDGINSAGTWYGSTGAACVAPSNQAPANVSFATTSGGGGW